MTKTLFERMKSYESISSHSLMNRTPVIIRVDGKNFSNFTSKMKKPFDMSFASAMKFVAGELVKAVQNARFCYVFSDEISIVTTDYQNIDSQNWFDNSITKIVSVSAGLASAAFYKSISNSEHSKLLETKLPCFDSRAFNIPKEEVANYFFWRQKDCERNSVQSLARAHFSQKELMNKHQEAMISMLLQKGVDWNEVYHHNKSGSIFTKKLFTLENSNAVRNKWVCEDAPSFVSEKNLIEELIRD